MARKSGFIRRNNVMRRETQWVSISIASTAIGSAGSATLIRQANAALLALRPFTIVRTRVALHMRSDQISAAENWGASYGFAVVSDQAAAIGVTAVPTPDTDRGSDLWWMYEEYHARFAFTTGVAYIEQGFGWMADSKAMRKVEDGQTFVGVAETSSIDSSVVLIDSGRLLIKLH